MPCPSPWTPFHAGAAPAPPRGHLPFFPGNLTHFLNFNSYVSTLNSLIEGSRLFFRKEPDSNGLSFAEGAWSVTTAHLCPFCAKVTMAHG